MRVLHTADIHLGVKTYGSRDSATGLNTRLLDVKHSFEAVVQRALDEDVDAFLFSGDAYHTADPTPTQQKIFAETLQPVADADIPIILIVGNHDHPVTFGRASSLDIFEFLDGDVHFFSKPAQKVPVIPTKSGPLQLIPLPWPVRSQIISRDEYRKMKPDELKAFIEELYVTYVQRRTDDIRSRGVGVTKDGEDVPLSPENATILAGHVTVQGSELSGSERTSLIASEPKFTVGQLALSPIDYVALGHIHQFQNRNPEGHPPVVYSGSVERVTFKERDETKGSVLVTIDTEAAPGMSSRTSTSFEPTPARPFIAVYVDARDTPDPTELILQAIEKHDVTDAIVRVRYRVDESQIAVVDSARIRDALADAEKVAAIERSVDPSERRRRTVVTRDSDLEDAMRQYVGQHDELQDMEDDLVNAALTLQNELDTTRQ
ncbi:exonuclease sbcCD subunit D [Longibacter salinarum]|uniref:Nuclease SbcCD subunit D n=1 Tax=Longibacter salinarum TaxID=1850348 RepID=A0A2A8D0L5_9BACT|nr:exonuclease SbcCD subunit D [Longibacter salinarum]PEN14343.1 exonuclease sbcCD subunit D [Longibacter salinarum]